MSHANGRPVVGVISYGKGRDPANFILPVSYVDALRKAGGQVLMFPPGEDAPGEVLALCDALVLAGGGDVEPRHYAQDPHPMLYGHDPARDAQELALVPAALRVKIPLLAICRGLQVLNVALGGDLIQHLPDVVGETVIHRGNEERRFLPHLARVSPQSQLAEVLGASTVRVASAHHQAVGRAGRGVVPVAWAEDGIVEAIEIEGEPQVLAVQWHPEESDALDASQVRLFQWLIQRGRAFRAGHSLR